MLSGLVQTMRLMAHSRLDFTLILLIALISVSCARATDTDTGHDEGRLLESVRGFVLEVEAESLISLEALEVQADDGAVWRFEGRGKVVAGFTPSHLNEHKLLGQSVSVIFYREGAALVLHDITD